MLTVSANWIEGMSAGRPEVTFVVEIRVDPSAGNPGTYFFTDRDVSDTIDPSRVWPGNLDRHPTSQNSTISDIFTANSRLDLLNRDTRYSI